MDYSSAYAPYSPFAPSAMDGSCTQGRLCPSPLWDLLVYICVFEMGVPTSPSNYWTYFRVLLQEAQPDKFKYMDNV